MIRCITLSRFVMLLGSVLLAGLCTASATAQQRAVPGTIDVRDVPLDEALQTFIATAQVGVIYTHALVAGKRTGCVATGADPEEALRCMLRGTRLTFEQLPSGTYAIRQAAPQQTQRDSLDAQKQDTSAYGEIRGWVWAQATDQPLAGVHVRVLGTSLGAATGPDGRFLIARVPPGTYTLAASMVGYEQQYEDRIPVIGRQRIEQHFELAEAATALEEVVVTPGHYRLRQQDPAARQTLTQQGVRRLPATGEDVYRAVARLPGLSHTVLSSRFGLRGGEHDEVLVLLDGMELYEPFHLRDLPGGGGFSILDAQATGDLDVITGAFPVEYGDRLSGVFNIHSATPPADYNRLSLGLNLLNTRLITEGRFDDGDGQWLLVGRRGLWDLFLSDPHDPDVISPKFYDALGKMSYQVNPRHTLAAHVLRAGDDFVFQDPFDGTNYVAKHDHAYHWLTWKARLQPRLVVQTLLSGGHIEFNRHGSEPLEFSAFSEFLQTHTSGLSFLADERRRFSFLTLKQDWTFDHSERHLLKAGFELKELKTTYDYFNRERLFATELMGPRPSEERFDTTNVQRSITGSELGLYVGSRHRVFKRLTAELGLRYDLATWTSQDHLSHRLNLAYRPGERTVLRLGVGEFYQTQDLYQLDAPDGNAAFHPAERATHIVVGVEHDLDSGIRLRAEAYRKRLTHLRPRYVNLSEGTPTTFQEAQADRVRLLPKTGTVHGLEVFARQERSDRLQWWASYSLAFAENIIDGIHTPPNFAGRFEAAEGVARSFTAPTDFDQRHTLQMDLSYRLSRKWHLTLAWQFHTGRPFTEIDVERIDQADGSVYLSPIYGQLNGRRFPAYHRLDARIARHFTFKHSRLSTYLDIINVYNRRNMLFTETNVQYRTPPSRHVVDQGFIRGLPIVPLFGVRWDLFH